MSTLEPGIGPRYQQATMYCRQQMTGRGRPPRPDASEQTAAPPLRELVLPPPETIAGPGLWATIAARRSHRDFTSDPLTLPQLSQLLWAATGVTASQGGYQLRAAASAGALYPHETYLFISRVQGCPPGLWHYRVQHHRLAQLAEGNFGHELASACLEQEFCATAALVVAFGAVWERCAWKYGDRALRYLYLDAGHLGSHLQLACQALGLGSVNVGAFFDGEVNALAGLDGKHETAVYLTAVGVPSS
jgi:SagB-type dehydrogenase family enzyme